jgi:hypothetical protein
MNPSNNWLKASRVRIPLFAALVYAYFCAPVSLEHKAFVQIITAPSRHDALADSHDPRIDFAHSFAAAQAKSPVIHVFVALADNEHQGIIPVPPALGNGEDAARNLYWGAAYGVRTFFRRSAEWKEISSVSRPKSYILERSVFQHRASKTILVADAYEGSEIKQALTDFFQASAGLTSKEISFPSAPGSKPESVPASADLVVYVGHDGLMDFSLPLEFPNQVGTNRPAIILACASKSFFKELLHKTGAQPLLWTTGLMAPEAYTLKAAVDGWILSESPEQIRQRAAAAYSKYQKCSLSAAMRVFSNSW